MNIGNDEKKYWTIKEVSDLTKVKQTTLRFWEQEFFQLRPIKNKFGHRVYTKKDIDIILKIKNFLYTKKMTIKGTKELLNENKNREVDLKKIKKDLLDLLEILKKIKNKE